MAKTIANPVSEQPAAAETARSAPPRVLSATRTWPLLLLVLVCGLSGMALEMTASRMLAPHFGSSLYIWAILIGLIMIFLTIGYSLGGRLADRAPRPAILYS